VIIPYSLFPVFIPIHPVRRAKTNRKSILHQSGIISCYIGVSED
jgi:hypothetical protein